MDGSIAVRAARPDDLEAVAEVLVACSGDDVVGTVTFCRAGTPWAEVCAPGEAEFRMLAYGRDL